MRRSPNLVLHVLGPVLLAVAIAATVVVASSASASAWAPVTSAPALPAPATEPLPPPSTADPSADPTADPAPVAEPTTVAGDEAGIGGLDAGANTPSPRGEPEPSRTQRVADTAIAIGLLVVFVAGVAVAIWSARRRPSTP